MDFIPTTDADKQNMLNQIGVKSVDDLIQILKPRLQDKLGLSRPLSELELVNQLRFLSQKNKLLKYFIGAGSYNHYIPARRSSSDTARRVSNRLHPISA